MNKDWIDERYGFDEYQKNILRVVYDLMEKAPKGIKLKFWFSDSINIKLEKA